MLEVLVHVDERVEEHVAHGALALQIHERDGRLALGLHHVQHLRAVRRTMYEYATSTVTSRTSVTVPSALGSAHRQRHRQRERTWHTVSVNGIGS